jgi:hypothetical protein
LSIRYVVVDETGTPVLMCTGRSGRRKAARYQSRHPGTAILREVVSATGSVEQHSIVPTEAAQKVFSYGARAPEGPTASVVEAQFAATIRFRNEIVACERQRRDTVSNILAQHSSRLARLDTLITALETALQQLRERQRLINQARRQRTPDPTLAARVRAVKKRLQALRQAQKALKTSLYADPVVRASLQAADAAFAHSVKQIYHGSPLHWGTKGAISLGLQRIRTGRPPQFVLPEHWPGKLAVQLQHGATWQDLLNGHSQARIEIAGAIVNATHDRKGRPIPQPSPGGRRSRRPYYRLWFRVAGARRQAVWGTVRFAMHRPLPEGVAIKWIYVVREKIGTHWDYSVQFVATLPRSDPAGDESRQPKRPIAALNLGYRARNGAKRVAFLVGSDGAATEITLPAERLGALANADRTQSRRDQEFNTARDALTAWLTSTATSVPQWLANATKSISRWKSPARLASAVTTWRYHRFAGDTAIFQQMENWRKHNRHLYDWMSAERAAFRRWRQDFYRRLAANLRQTYAEIWIDATAWDALRERPPVERDDEPEWRNRRREAATAAPGTLRTILQQGQGPGRRVPPAWITQTCCHCGASPMPDWDAFSELHLRCSKGHVTDQDENAARNILRNALAASGPTNTP